MSSSEEDDLRLIAHDIDSDIAEIFSGKPSQSVAIYWLGQAGFVIDGGGKRLVIDPYLSNSLGKKYLGTRFPHERLMAAPVQPGAIKHVDMVLCTHHHTDHMDPESLPDLLTANPNAQLVAPAASKDEALKRADISGERLIALDAGDLSNDRVGIEVTATRAAHETLERDSSGKHKFLGYAIRLAGHTIFHSGDTIPFDGQAEEVRNLSADLALFPVNGRDETRQNNGVPGNMTVTEAVELARAANIKSVIAHHYGLFAFNTADPADINDVAQATSDIDLHLARVQVRYEFC